MIYLLFFFLVFIALVFIAALCKTASRQSPMPSNKEVHELENHLMRRGLKRASK